MPKERVAYYYQEDVGHRYYGPGHPMKPFRMKLAHHLILSYGLYRKMECYRPHKASPEELATFHSDDYVDFLRRVTPQNSKTFSTQMQKYNCGEFTDCPVFDNLYDFCQTYAGASIDGANRLNHGLADVTINWAGGLHHAKKCEASGFCYVNDIVLAILELLKFHPRVLYIDIDIHHGDGVEEAFYTTDRVMCVSFHKYGDFFPGTGALKDVGAKNGKYYSVNFPLNDGIDDDSYESVFKPVIQGIMEKYQPSAVVLQCGADSLTGDRLGVFNLTLKGHAECVRFVRSFGLPTMLVGGGGYTIRNVARCWANETATVLGETLPDYIPPNDYVEFFRPDYRLHLDPSPMDNLNSREYLNKCKAIVLENLKQLEGAPSVQFQDVPPSWAIAAVESQLRDNGGALHPDQRPGSSAAGAGGAHYTGHIIDGRREHEAEYFDGDKDQDGNRDATTAAADDSNAASNGASGAAGGAGAEADQHADGGGGAVGDADTRVVMSRKRRLDDGLGEIDETEASIQAATTGAAAAQVSSTASAPATGHASIAASGAPGAAVASVRAEGSAGVDAVAGDAAAVGAAVAVGEGSAAVTAALGAAAAAAAQAVTEAEADAGNAAMDTSK